MSHTTSTSTNASNSTSAFGSRRLAGWRAAALLPLALVGVVTTATAASAAPAHHRAHPVAAGGHGHKSGDSGYGFFDKVSAQVVNAVHGREYCDYGQSVYRSVAAAPGVSLTFTQAVSRTATWSTTGGVKLSFSGLKAALNLEGSVTDTKTDQVTVQQNILWTVPAEKMGVLDVYVRYQDWDFQTVGGLSHRFLGTGRAKVPVGLCGSTTTYPVKPQDCGPMPIGCLFQGVETIRPEAHTTHRVVRHAGGVGRLHR